MSSNLELPKNSDVLFTVVDSVAIVTLNRPSKFNAFSFEMFNLLTKIANHLSTRTDIRVVVIRGSGGNFSSGLDVVNVLSTKSNQKELMSPVFPHEHNLAQHVCVAWRLLPMPVMAIIEGVCFGAGFQLAMGCDIRVMSEDARLSVMEGKWGLVPDMGLAVTGKHIKKDMLRWLTYSAEVVDAETAAFAGISTMCVSDFEKEAFRLIEVLKLRSPDALREGKRLMWDEHGEWVRSCDYLKENKKDVKEDEKWEGWVAGKSDHTLLRLEMEAQIRLMKGNNHKEMVKANMERRAPIFSYSKL